jgi:tetratricopeptide (TPR) repeat protein
MAVLRFKLLFSADPAGGYAVHLFSPKGEGEGRFMPPPLPDEAGSPERTAWAEAALGEELFVRLFQGEILRLYERSLGLLDGEPEARLRLEIVLDPRLAVLQRLPWELMRQPGTPAALALGRKSPVVRYLKVPQPIYAAGRPAVLRILAVAAHPGHSCLELSRELCHLREACEGSGLAEVVEPAAPTLDALRRALLETPCHVLHFMGHGGSVSGQGERVLFFEDGDGGSMPVRGADLASKLADFSSLRLAVLNACESGASSAADGSAESAFDPFAGVATSLVLGGLPAVVAMRLPIADRAAIAFSRAFYLRLAAGDPVETAVSEGRQALHSLDPRGNDWAIPALFLRTPDGELFPDRDIDAEELPHDPWWRRFTRRQLAAALALLALLTAGGLGMASWWADHLLAEATFFGRQGRWTEARKRLLDAVGFAPGSREIQFLLARAQERRGFAGVAEEAYRRALELDPRSSLYAYHLGRFLNARGRYDEALPILGAALQLDRNRAETYVEQGTSTLRLKRPGEARRMAEAARRLQPDAPGLHRLLGELDLLDGRVDAAIVQLEQDRRRDPSGLGAAQTVSLLVQAYDRKDDPAAVCREVAELGRLDPKEVTQRPSEVLHAAGRHACPPA